MRKGRELLHLGAGMNFTPAPAQERIGFRGIDEKRILLPREEAHHESAGVPAPGLAEIALDDAEFGHHRPASAAFNRAASRVRSSVTARGGKPKVGFGLVM